MRNIFYVILLFLALCLAACTSDPPAPVIDRLPTSTSSKAEATSAPKLSTKNRPTYKTADWRPDTYIVKKGDTIEKIAKFYKADPDDIRNYNQIDTRLMYYLLQLQLVALSMLQFQFA